MQAEALSASRWDRDQIQIIIRIASGSTFVLELPCDQTVLNLRKQVSQALGRPATQSTMSLEWNGFELRNEQNLADLGIVNHSKIDCRPHLLGGSCCFGSCSFVLYHFGVNDRISYSYYNYRAFEITERKGGTRIKGQDFDRLPATCRPLTDVNRLHNFSRVLQHISVG
jgi:hypothetical protein